jgi:hypothetical protein
MKMALAIGRFVMLDLANHAAFTPQAAPLIYHFAKTFDGVPVGDGGGRHI